jgi:hypothetical protein
MAGSWGLETGGASGGPREVEKKERLFFGVFVGGIFYDVMMEDLIFEIAW